MADTERIPGDDPRWLRTAVIVVLAAIALVLIVTTVVKDDRNDRLRDQTAARVTPTTVPAPLSPGERCFDELGAVLDEKWVPGLSQDAVYQSLFTVYGMSDPRTDLLTRAFLDFQMATYGMGQDRASEQLWATIRDWCRENGEDFYD